jgi:hypothetical protein
MDRMQDAHGRRRDCRHWRRGRAGVRVAAKRIVQSVMWRAVRMAVAAGAI